MGHLLYEALTNEGYQLDRELFVLGNLLPDYLPEMVLTPHFTLKCQREIHIFTEALAGQPVQKGEQLPPEYALRLGILCHYLTDYFTYAHTPEFRLGLKEHAAYELRLDEYFRDHYTIEQSQRGLSVPASEIARDVAKDIYRNKRDYRASERTLETDVQFAFSVCLSSMKQLLAISEAREEHVKAPFRYRRFAAERYAFQSEVCRRRIVPRRAWCPACA
jgi:hypothetical protein